jgi:hypothetical protein
MGTGRQQRRRIPRRVACHRVGCRRYVLPVCERLRRLLNLVLLNLHMRCPSCGTSQRLRVNEHDGRAVTASAPLCQQRLTAHATSVLRNGRRWTGVGTRREAAPAAPGPGGSSPGDGMTTAPASSTIIYYSLAPHRQPAARKADMLPKAGDAEPRRKSSIDALMNPVRQGHIYF